MSVMNNQMKRLFSGNLEVNQNIGATSRGYLEQCLNKTTDKVICSD